MGLFKKKGAEEEEADAAGEKKEAVIEEGEAEKAEPEAKE